MDTREDVEWCDSYGFLSALSELYQGQGILWT